MQAMACGKPVVMVSDLPRSSTIQDLENGFLVRPGDTKALASKIILLLLDASLATQMGDRGRQKAVAVSSRDRLLGIHEALYSEMILKRQGLAPSFSTGAQRVAL